MAKLNFTGECWPLTKVHLLPPVERGSKIVAAGANYGKHVREFGLAPPPTTAIGPWIVTRDEFGGCMPDLRMVLRVNGDVR